ncbi:MFS transporter [Aeromonas schubertii]|uniref:MFS transporter n=1 Tax=Aeromonas schubertii TaxID=652 RepID=A0ABS7VDJ6_9GAMM|nr:MFS transporter [Aeromonas schubertii]MBZ6067442.1 MFS transporter [Aeromonas schubertii]
MIDQGTLHWWRATLALGLGSFLVFLNLYQAHPLLPLLAAQFAIPPLEAGAALSATTAGLALGLLPMARIADRHGRRIVMLGSLLGAILLSLWLSQITHFTGLLLLRFLQGVLLAGLPATAVAYMGEEFSKRALISAVGIYIAANSLGGIAGRVVAGMLAGALGGWHQAFLGIGLISLLLLPLVCWLLPPQQGFRPAMAQPGELVMALRQHLGSPLLVGAYLIGGLNFMVFLNQYSYLTFLLSQPPFSVPTQWLGLLFLTYLSGTLASSLSGRINRYLGTAHTMAGGIIIMISGALLLLLGSLAGILGGLLVASFGFFLTHASASSWVGQHVRKHRAIASSLYLIAYYLGASLGGLYLHPFWEWAGLTGMVIGMVMVLLLTLGISLSLGRHSVSEATRYKQTQPQ